MARLQILELPEGSDDDRAPFVLVVDEWDADSLEENSVLTDYWDAFGKRIGARGVLFADCTIDIPANNASAYLGELEVASSDRRTERADQAEAKLKALLDEAAALQKQLDEARQWARHGYEIGQRHCGWTDHGGAPDWLTNGWPNSFDSCEHLKHASDLEEAEAIRKRVAKEQKATLADALGMDPLRDWDDILNAARGLRKHRDAQAATIDRVRTESARIRRATRTWEPVADLIDAALNDKQSTADA